MRTFTIDPEKKTHRAKLKKIGGRIVETCFTCVHENLRGYCILHDFWFVDTKTNMNFCCDKHSAIADDSLAIITSGVSKVVPRGEKKP